MDSYSRYDIVLMALGLAVVAMVTGVAITPALTIGSGLIGAAIVGVALFAIPPVSEETSIAE